MKLLVAIALTGFFSLITPMSASEEKAPMVRTDLQIVSLKTKDALTLIPKLRNKETAAEGVIEIERMIEDETAELIDWMTTLSLNESRSTSENVLEVRYPTEFEPPQFPGSSWHPMPEWHPLLNPRPSESDRLNPKVNARRLNTDNTVGYETRNTGTTVEIEPTIIKGTNLIEATSAPQWVRLHGFKELPLPIALNGTRYITIQPDFSTHKTTQFLTLVSGQWTLYGTYVEKDEPKTVLFLLRATIKP